MIISMEAALRAMLVPSMSALRPTRMYKDSMVLANTGISLK